MADDIPIVHWCLQGCFDHVDMLPEMVGHDKLFSYPSMPESVILRYHGCSFQLSQPFGMGVKGIATPPAGDARATLAAYATHTGLPYFVVAPQDAPGSCIQQARLYGVEGKLISDAGRRGWCTVATLREPIAPRTKNDFLWASGLPGVGNYSL